MTLTNNLLPLDDTIIAISTPMGHGGLGIVRLTGSKSRSIALKIFTPKGMNQNLPPRQAVLGYLHDFKKKEFFDEVYLTYFPAPATYTREDMVEISCHGSPVILEETVRLGIKAGARDAAPGEFTLRAYLNGRIDIIQAEAVRDLIESNSLTQAKISFKQLGGSLSRRIFKLRDQMIHLLSQIEASIEFPDDGLKISSNHIQRTLRGAIDNLKSLVNSYEMGRSLSEGVTLTIAGRSNVGTSTLFNALLERNRAIVTPFPGTTRDFIQEKFRIEDRLFSIVDTAGLSNTSHPVEREGIKRGQKLAAEADGILLLIDASQEDGDEDTKLIRKFKGKRTLLLLNKIDLPLKADINKLKVLAGESDIMEISALKGTHIEKLRQYIRQTYTPDSKVDDEVILHLRQKLLLEEIMEILVLAQDLILEGHTEEFFVEEIRRALPIMGRLTGEIQAEDIIQGIFDRFCVGK